MAGGIGSRFWPMSRTRYPKQFLDILNTGETLLQATVRRFKKFIPAENIYIITTANYKDLISEQIPDINSGNILYEPVRKNTAPAIAYVSYKLRELNPRANIICAPADHLITNEELFEQTCLHALDFTSHIKSLVTLGIKPTSPNTGYGYIQYEQIAVSDNVYLVKTFTEKPDIELAKAFIMSGDFLWNAGIFVWEVQNIIKAFEELLPELAEVFEGGKDSFNTDLEEKAIGKIYSQCTNISIDYGIMEKASNVYVIPSTFGWSDLGSWASWYELYEKDYFGNAVSGSDVYVVDATKNLVHVKNGKLVVLQGLEDSIVVDTDDVLLICKKENEQEIKNYVAEIKKNKGDKFL